MITTAHAQDISVGPVRVDTGNDFMDLGFVVILIVVLLIAYGVKRWLDRR